MKNPTPTILAGGLPLVGHSLQFMRDKDTLFRRGYAAHGNIFGIKLFNQPVAVLTGPTLNRFFYTETDKSLNINEVYGFLRAALGEVLFTASKDVYHRQRPALQTIFSREKMGRYVERMQTEVQTWLDNLGEAGQFDVSQEMLRLTQYVVGHAFLGDSFHEELPEEFWEEYTHISNSLNPAIPANWPTPKNLRRDKANVRIRATLDNVIKKRRQNPDAYDDMISLLITTPVKDGTFLNDEEIARLFMGLVFAGHETTAGQAAWVVISLLHHPDYLDNIKTEIREHYDFDEPITGKVLRNMQHLYWAIDEVSRLYPSAPLQLRLAEKDIDIEGYHIPKGWLLLVNAANSHHLPELWENPAQFDPYRFSPERGEGKNSFSTIGFGGGIHKCTGMNFAKNEMAIITTLLFQQFHLELITEETEVAATIGASRPTPTIIKYRRRVPSFDYTDEVKTLLDELVSLPG